MWDKMTEKPIRSQQNQVLNYLRGGRQITKTIAIRDLGVMCIYNVIRELKKKGHNITHHPSDQPKTQGYWVLSE